VGVIHTDVGGLLKAEHQRLDAAAGWNKETDIYEAKGRKKEV